jgi:hypothetical protein
MAPSIRTNVERVLAHLGLLDVVVITEVEADRVYGWPVDGRLRSYVEASKWHKDIKVVTKHFHGNGVSFREPNGERPAMQIVFHSTPAGDFVEMDLDKAAPVDVVNGVIHLEEVAENALLHRKTDQAEIAELLDKRFPPTHVPRPKGEGQVFTHEQLALIHEAQEQLLKNAKTD